MRKNVYVFFLAFLVSLLTWLAAHPQMSPEATSVVIKEITPFSYVCVPYKGPFTDMEKVIGTLMQAMQTQSLFPPLGPLIGVYYNSPAQVKPEELVWEVGFPVTPQVMPLTPLEKKQWSLTTVAADLHVGSYETTEKTINKIFEWINANGYVPAGPIMERYLDMDPSKVKAEELKTEIWIPCKKAGN